MLTVFSSAFAQMASEKEAKLWVLRQNEIKILYQEGNLEGALEIAQEALLLAENGYGADSKESISSLLNLAQIQSEFDYLEEANQTYELALEKSVVSFGEQAKETLNVLDNYGEFLNSIDPEMGAPVLKESL